MKAMVIKVSEIDEYLKMAKIEMETKQALQNYDRIRFLVKSAKEHLKEMKQKFDEQKEKCEHYNPEQKLIDNLAKLKAWTK